MNKILIIGCPGSGKTTLSKELSKRLNLPLVHLDKIWWFGNWQNVSREQFDIALLKELQKPSWIIDGNYNRTISLRLQYCDTIIYLDYSKYICIWSAIKRRILNIGKVRDDMGGNCIEHFDMDFFYFLKDIWNFNNKHRRNYLDMLNNEKDKKVLIFHDRKECSKFLNRLEVNKNED